jgi:hypothetical protein
MTARIITVVLLVAGVAHARGLRELTRLPDDKVAGLAPMLKHGDIALVESRADGTLKQVTMMLFVRASPEIVRDLVTRPGEFKKFVPHVSKSTWEPRPGGGLSTWRLDLPLSSFEETNEYSFQPGLGPVIVTSPDEDDAMSLRWEFLPSGGGTLLVLYGFCDIRHSNAMVRTLLKRMPVMEHGLALATEFMLAANMRLEAERRAAATGAAAVPADVKSAGFGFLLERGQVVVLRSAGGRLGDVSLLDRVFAPAAKIAQLITRPGEWSRFIPGVEESREHARGAGTVEYSADFAVPTMTWTGRWAMRFGERTVEGAGVGGDLEGTHFQWDLTARGAGETLVVYRVNMSLARHSQIARTLFEYQPSLEHGINTAVALVYLRAIRGRAEGWGETR